MTLSLRTSSGNYSRFLKNLYNHNCSRCELSSTLEDGEMICVPGNGNWSYRKMIVGEAPGRNEALGGEPFIGQSGQILDSALDNAGWKREHTFVANVVRCRPPQNRKPTEREEAACRIYLLREIAAIKPAAIMTLGNHALRAITGGWGVTSLAGKWQTIDMNGLAISVLPNYHPAYILRNRSLLPKFQANVNAWIEGLHSQEEVG